MPFFRPEDEARVRELLAGLERAGGRILAASFE